MSDELIAENCPSCVTLFRAPPESFLLDRAAGTYEFTCPHCREHIVKQTDELTLQLFPLYDVPERRPPFTADEILDLVDEMRRL